MKKDSEKPSDVVLEKGTYENAIWEGLIEYGEENDLENHFVTQYLRMDLYKSLSLLFYLVSIMNYSKYKKKPLKKNRIEEKLGDAAVWPGRAF